MSGSLEPSGEGDCERVERGLQPHHLACPLRYRIQRPAVRSQPITEIHQRLGVEAEEKPLLRSLLTDRFEIRRGTRFRNTNNVVVAGAQRPHSIATLVTDHSVRQTAD